MSEPYPKPETVAVTLYGRHGCNLCAEAKAVILLSAQLHHLGIDLSEIDIDRDPALRARFDEHVPVVFIHGQEVSRYRVDPDAFVAAVSAAAGSEQPAASPKLARERCVPCRAGTPPLSASEVTALLPELSASWQLDADHRLRREFRFPDFASALEFTNRAGAIAEEQGHHPDIHLGWGRAVVTIWTHAIDGLTRSDFVLAALIDAL